MRIAQCVSSANPQQAAGTYNMIDLVWAIKNGDSEQVRNIIENENIDVDKVVSGRTLVHYAADYGQDEILKYLLDKGANPDVSDRYGITGLLAAIWEGHTKCVKILLEKGAKSDGLTPYGASYIDAAEKDEIKELLKLY